MRCRWYPRAELGSRQAKAALVLVGVFVEMRHLRSRTPTPNNLNQLLAIKLGRVQIGSLSGRARIAMAVAVHAVAELAVRLFMKQAIAERSGLRGMRLPAA